MTFAPVNKSRTKAYTGCVTTDKLLDELLSEKRRDIDEGDVNRLHREIFTNKNTTLEAIIQQYYDDLYGTENAPKDEFGKLYVIEPTSEQKSRALNSFLNNLQKAINKKEEEKEKRKREQEKKTYQEDDEEEKQSAEKFIWKGNGCEACAEYDGQEFTLDEVPNTHPNCKCDLISKDDPQKTTKPEFDYKEYPKQKAEKEKNNEEIKEEERRLLEQVKKNLKDGENIKYHPYLDTKGIITTGNGANIDSKEAFMKVSWQIDGRPATKAEKEAAYQSMENTKNNKEYGQKIVADEYQNKTNLRIDDEETERMRDEHLKNDSKAIKKEIPDFDKLPFELKEVLMDIKYNTGGVRNLPANIKNINDIPEENRKKYWPNLHQAIRDKDIEGIAKEIHRKDVSKERNEWARNKILSIKKW